ncbi:MATE family efflux transporter [Treponema brennaborense]|uniref:MATE family efflux transporter n=1 Tax=Treponema brennaborense TaxID=81028 RepID=UPI0002E5E28F|nr:MATE family efflux transporter [Treponema brennaborense]
MSDEESVCQTRNLCVRRCCRLYAGLWKIRVLAQTAELFQNIGMNRFEADTAGFSAMLETPVPRLVSRLAVPTIISMLVSALYNTADTFFVSQLGTSASGAVGIVFSLMAVIQAVGFTLGMGAGSLVSRNLGARQPDAADGIASTAFFSALLGGLIITAGGMLFLDPLMHLLGATPTILPYARDYGRYILFGAPLMCASFVLNNVLRSQGKAALSLIGLASGGILNIILDPMFIFGLEMGISGAAVATLISQCVSFSLLLSMFARRKSTARIKLRFAFVRFGRNAVQIVKNGLPSLCRQGLAALAAVALNVQAGRYGDAAVAGMSVTARVFMFVASVMIGLGQGFQPVAGFNYGAGRYDRVKAAFWFIVRTGCVLMGCASVILFIAAPHVVRVFRNDPAVVAVGSAAIRWQSVALILQPLIVGSNMLLQSTGQSRQATFLSSCRQGIFFLPLIVLLPYAGGLAGIEITQTVSDLLTAAVCVPFLIRFFRRLNAAPIAR